MARGTPDWWKRAEALISVDFIQLNDTPGSYAGQAGKGVKVTALVDGLEFADTDLDDHSARHESGGADEINLAGMTPGLHAARHESGGADEIDLAGMTPGDHAARHEPGGGDVMEVDAVAATGSLRTLGNGAQQAAPGNRAAFKIGAFIRNAGVASGTQTINDVGFQPDYVEFLANVTGTPPASTGFDDGTTHYCIFNGDKQLDESWGNSLTESVFMVIGAADVYSGHISTLNAAGFIVTWTRDGAPVGTINIAYKAVKL